MKVMFSPWRSDYTVNTARKTDGSEDKNNCIFCMQLEEQNDPKHFIFRRFNHFAIMLNRYPYNAGHLLIFSLQHEGKLQNFSADARMELMELTTKSVEILEDVLKPAGFNVGLNLGKAAGAGIPTHLHMHILPRWSDDTNFLPALGQTRLISFDLTQIYEMLKPAFDALP